jgi:hypothetical protein
MKKILEMLTYRRPAGSPGEADFIKRYILPFKPTNVLDNLIITIPGDGETLFSCHTDTVHRNDERQIVLYDEGLGIAYKDDKEPLGGDNTAGVWLLLEMIKAGIPGTYMFHYGEERGCIGSKAMAKQHPNWLKGFKRAIAFDRRANTSIITHQMGTRCCSNEFGDALAAALGNDYKRDDTGLYTDTASYMELIPECSNVSVGYDHEHGPEEIVDVNHLLWLREVVKNVKWPKLPTLRDPTVVENTNWEYDDPDYYIDLAFNEITDFQSAADLVRYEPDIAANVLLAFVDYKATAANDDSNSWDDLRAEGERRVAAALLIN